ncbi:hypothetical protein [Shouchella shacheensis]|uniref:hypothetical protein n=1 Tax=Shouchella shacheensis TaxID=1649580 RepID=UPI00073FAFCC|nr:hypothetical protein [Shouchella shacheensis]
MEGLPEKSRFWISGRTEKSRASTRRSWIRKSGGGSNRSENFGDLTKEIPTLDFVVRAKNLEAPSRRSWIRKSGGASLTSDKFWSDGSIKPGLGLIWRREESSQLDQRKSVPLSEEA